MTDQPTPTSRTDEFARAECCDLEHALSFARELERELAETAKDFHCIAELLVGHDATECRANLVKLKEDLSAERALADRLAEALNESTEGFGDRMSCEESCQCAGRRIVGVNKKALTAWKEARRGTD